MDARQLRFMLINTLILLATASLISACKTTDTHTEQTTARGAARAQSATPTSAERGQELDPMVVSEGQDASLSIATSVERGQELYRANCALCHGEKGERGAAPLKDTAQQWDDATIAEFIVKGVPAKGMPKLASLTSEQIADIVAFIRSWRQQ